MTNSKWIDFVELPFAGKTKQFSIVSKDNTQMTIGYIKWYPPWRRYCFYSKHNCIFEEQCLGDIINFIQALMLDRKIARQNEKQ